MVDFMLQFIAYLLFAKRKQEIIDDRKSRRPDELKERKLESGCNNLI